MYTYTAYNLVIQSEILLPELIPIESNRVDVTVRLGNLSGPEQRRSNGGDYFVGHAEGVGTFLAREGCEIVADPVPGVDEAVLRPTIQGPFLATILRQRGLLVLHASSFVANGMAIAFMAESGWGKSTLVDTFHSLGYPILTDDVMAIQFDGHHMLVLPGIPQVKLWSDAAQFIGHAPEALPPLHSRSQKLSHRLQTGFFQSVLPLKRLYVLDYGEQHEVIPLAPQDAFVELVHHSRAMTLLSAPEFRIAHMQQCSRLLQGVQICRLQRKRSLEAMPELIELIKADIASLTVPQGCQTSFPADVSPCEV